MFFTGDKSEELVKQFRVLCKRLHPDMGGDQEQFVAMKKEFDLLIAQSSDKKFQSLSDALSFVVNIDTDDNLRIEIIGVWLYVFGAFEIKDQLKTKGFWFSSKHKAWIYNGDKKINMRSYNSTNDLRLKFSHKQFSQKERDEKKLEMVSS